MTDATQAADEDAAPPARSGRKKLILIGAVALGLAAAAGGGAWFFLAGGAGGAPEEAEAATTAQAYFYDLPPITVNLNTSGGDEQFLKLSVALEVPEESMIETIEPRMPRVLDAFQVYLRELRPEDLEGSAGVYRLKEELRRRVNLAVSPAVVDDVLFKEILVQ